MDAKIWGGLVPYGQVWRAGANENTTITFPDAVTIEGKPLAAGTYGLHMIPNEDQWTVIFSKMHTAWGSFSYDAGGRRLASERQAADEPSCTMRCSTTSTSCSPTLPW